MKNEWKSQVMGRRYILKGKIGEESGAREWLFQSGDILILRCYCTLDALNSTMTIFVSKRPQNINQWKYQFKNLKLIFGHHLEA